MHVSAGLTVVGLCLDLAGAFLLAAGVIGIDRISGWKRDRVDRSHRQLRGLLVEGVLAERKFNRFVAIVLVLAVAVGLAFYVLLRSVTGVVDERGRPVSGAPHWLLPIVIGVMGATLFVDAVTLLLRMTSGFLAWVEEIFGRGTIGTSGIVLVAVGWLFQVLGALRM